MKVRLLFIAVVICAVLAGCGSSIVETDQVFEVVSIGYVTDKKLGEEWVICNNRTAAIAYEVELKGDITGTIATEWLEGYEHGVVRAPPPFTPPGMSFISQIDIPAGIAPLSVTLPVVEVEPELNVIGHAILHFALESEAHTVHMHSPPIPVVANC